MRLGQLARKLSKRPADILEFLSIQNVSTDEIANYRLTDDQVRQAFQEFAPDMLVSEASLTEVEKTEDLPIVDDFKVEEPSVVETAIETPPLSTPESTDEEKPEAIETIKAPKVSLSGLKVLGKIDLPEPKKKEEPKVEDTEATTDTPPTETPKPKYEGKGRPQRQDRRQDRRDDRPRKNPVVLKREREARDAEEKRKDELKRQKESRTQYYQQRVKPAAPTKAAKIYDESVEQMTDIPAAPPKTLLGKLWRWLTT